MTNPELTLHASPSEFYWQNVKLDVGYIDAQLFCCGHTIELCFSHAYEPFTPLIKWLEVLCENITHPITHPEMQLPEFTWNDERLNYKIEPKSLSKTSFAFDLSIDGWVGDSKQYQHYRIHVPTDLFIQQMLNFYSQIHSCLLYKYYDFFEIESRDIEYNDYEYFIPYKLDFMIDVLRKLLINKVKGVGCRG